MTNKLNPNPILVQMKAFHQLFDMLQWVLSSTSHLLWMNEKDCLAQLNVKLLVKQSVCKLKLELQHD